MMRVSKIVVPAIVAAMLPVSVAFAGDGNTVFLLQDSSSGPGNNLVIDQSAASGSRVTGDSLDLQPARQIGGGNSGEITLEDEGATVFFSQNSIGSAGALGNSATITGGAFATIILDQNGVGNIGDISVTGANSTAALRQTGDRNEGNVFVSGNQSIGDLTQTGDDNSFTVRVEGNNTTAIYTQVGNNLTAANGVGASVFSNGGTVIINQTASQ